MIELIEKNIKLFVPDKFSGFKLDDLLNTRKYYSQCKSCDFWLSNDNIDLFIECKSLNEVDKSTLDKLIREAICQLRCSHFVANTKNVHFYLFIVIPKKWALWVSSLVMKFSTAEREIAKIPVNVCIDIEDFDSVLKKIDSKISVGYKK